MEIRKIIVSVKINFRFYFNLLRVFGILLFIIILLNVDLRAVVEAILATNIYMLIVGILFQINVLIIKGIRWHILNDGDKKWNSWALNLGRFYESYALGIVTPGRVGELVKAGHENDKHKIYDSGVKVLAERGMDIGIFMILAGLSVMSGHYVVPKPFYGLIFTSVGSIIIVFSSFLIFDSSFTTLVINKLLEYMPGWHKSLKFESKNVSLSIIFCIFMLSTIANLSYFVSCFYLGRAVGIDAGFIWISGAVAISGLLNMLPITVMGLGTRELIFLHVLSYFDYGAVLSFSFLVVIVAQIGGGMFSLLAGHCLLFATRGYNYD